VRWDELQPAAGVVDAPQLARVERIVALAAAAGLRALPTLCGGIGGTSFMPAWTRTLRDLYTGPLREAQVRIANAIAERFAGNASIVAWDLLHAFSTVREPRRGMLTSGEHASEPVAEPDVAAWSTQIAAPLRAAKLGVTVGAYEGDLTHDTSVRLGSLCAPLTFASMQGTNELLPFARDRYDPEAIPFLALLTAAFSFKPVLITGIGNAEYPGMHERENAAYATAVLERLHADGRLGAYWWCWNDDMPGSADAPHDPSYAILRPDGSEKPAAAALAAFAREERPVVRSSDKPMISSTYYYRTLPDAMHTLYDAFLGARL
jgi:hypothetical protein